MKTNTIDKVDGGKVEELVDAACEQGVGLLRVEIYFVCTSGNVFENRREAVESIVYRACLLTAA